MQNILTDILTHKRAEVAACKAQRPLRELEAACSQRPATRSLRQALAASDTGIIAEFKRRSPSKGWIHADARVEEIVPAYVENGAAAHSILTNEAFFGGRLADVETARPLTSLPILRKEFIVDAYQLYEARAAGADAVLLIAAALPAAQCRQLAAEARALGLEVLLEVHHERELEAYTDDVSVVGVNNRNLDTFHTDPEVSVRLAGKLPAEALRISESGLSSPDTVCRLREAGYRGFLIGETFMREVAPGAALAAFIQKIRSCS